MKQKNNLVVFVVIILSILVIYNVYSYFTKSNPNETKEISYTTFLSMVDDASISKVSINNSLLKAQSKDNKSYLVGISTLDPGLITALKNKNIDVSFSNPESKSSLGSWILIILFFLFIFFIFRSLRSSNNSGGGGASGAFGFGKSRAKLQNPKDSSITFNDVAGIDEAKEELQELVEFLKSPAKFQKLGAKIPKGCLLVGSPGAGKTLLARAVAGEAKVPFFSISGSDFVEMFVGVGASRVRDLFAQAKKSAPCIIFIDEIDAVGRKRGSGHGGGNDEREQTLNQLLVEMDGFEVNNGIIIMAATNRPDVLDNALLRPGRFDRQITVPLPDVIGREKILKIYLSKLPLSKDVDVTMLARGTTGFSGADLANLANEAVLLTARNNKTIVTMEDFEKAKDKIVMGSERKSAKMSDDDRKLTAYHEAGHALVAFKVEGFYPVHKVTIIPRGRALGVTSFIPEKDEYNKSYSQLNAQLAVLFGGRISEELVRGEENITTGASGDIQMATNIAKRMVTEWGFGTNTGRIRYSENEGEGYPGYISKSVSEQTARDIENEVRILIEKAELKAREILTKYRQEHLLISEALLEYETLSGDEAQKVAKGMTIKEIRESQTVKVNNKNDSSTDSSVPHVG